MFGRFQFEFYWSASWLTWGCQKSRSEFVYFRSQSTHLHMHNACLYVPRHGSNIWAWLKRLPRRFESPPGSIPLHLWMGMVTAPFTILDLDLDSNTRRAPPVTGWFVKPISYNIYWYMGICCEDKLWTNLAIWGGHQPAVIWACDLFTCWFTCVDDIYQ